MPHQQKILIKTAQETIPVDWYKDLPDVNCLECGVCCMFRGSPPYDLDEIEHLPDVLKKEIIDYRNKARNGGIFREALRLPCFWFDVETNQCIHHKHKPKACKSYIAGGLDCLRLRKKAGIV